MSIFDLSDSAIDALYHFTANQTLRAQDERIARAFARNVGRHISELANDQPAHQEGMVPVPTSADQAHGMINMGLMWLKAHAPERLLAGATDLHAAIMNIPADTSKYGHASANGALAYKEGHRDARHAAAELVITQRTKGTK